MNISSYYEAIKILARAAADNPDHIRFLAQLLGVEPCPVCDFIKYHCVCPCKSPLIGHNED